MELIRRKLWGYPDLVEEFHDSVRPLLVKARDNRRMRRRRGHRGNKDSVPAPAVVGQEEDDTASNPHQSSQTAPPDDGPGPSGVKKTDVQDDRPTASTSVEALDPTFGDPDFPLDVPRIGEGSHLSNEIVEVTSTSEYEDESSRVAQRKGKARE